MLIGPVLDHLLSLVAITLGVQGEDQHSAGPVKSWGTASFSQMEMADQLCSP